MNLQDGEDPTMLKGATFVRSFRNEPHYTLWSQDSSVSAVTCYKLDDRYWTSEKNGVACFY
jgi:hypothetical protein